MVAYLFSEVLSEAEDNADDQEGEEGEGNEDNYGE